MISKIIYFSYASPLHFLLLNVLVILVTTSAATVITSYGGGNETDHQALLNIKSMITRDPYGALVSWNNSLHFCDWAGVICGKKHKRVTSLTMDSQRLEGSLSPHVGNLSFLRVLYLANNSFEGVIPNEIGRLSRLRTLVLAENKFSGYIPSNISYCSNLELIEFTQNMLHGSIPKEIGSLAKLNFLDLSNNNLTCGIPSFLGNITSMKRFSVVNNPLGGSIPDTLGRWKNLSEIYCGGCNLSGRIPYTLFNLSFLSRVSVSDNQLTGSLPRTIMLPQLSGIQLNKNQLSGNLPQSISNSSKLQELYLNNNKFSGKLEVDFGKLKYIWRITLHGNNFGSYEVDEMKFIDTLQNCSRLEHLYLDNCEFKGVLPESIGNLSDILHTLDLSENQLHGNLPSSIGNLFGLDLLSLNKNRFTGNIPSSIARIPGLHVLALSENQLSGRIPDALGNLSSLINLDLRFNRLEGSIPSTLGNCSNLLELYLNDNKLSGKIPPQLFQLSTLSKMLDLSHNSLFGSLPTEVGDLKMLSSLDLSDNKLSGNIPSSLGSCVSLTNLSLKGNLFQGMIPPSLSFLKGLKELDISRNNFSGQIPQFLERFSLEYLNLSYNHFEGEVPKVRVFANVSTFSVLGNSMLCGGIVELGLPKCKETKKKSKTFNLFLIVILIASALFTLFSVTCLAYFWRKKKSKRQTFESTSERFMRVTYSQLFKATDRFSEANLIGKGGFMSSVYKGILAEVNDRFVAVKVLHLHMRGAQKSFMRECEVWRNIRHRNLLKIITSCSSVDFQGNDFKALVYDFMPNGSLHDWLHSNGRTLRPHLSQRINILMGVASALDYIHNHCVPTFVHGDLKPSNILLDDDMVAHVGDFGLARFLGTTSYQHSSTGIKGTIGYAPPEYGLGNEMTSSGDIYSFGILLLEVITGKSPTDEIFNEGFSLHKFASQALPDRVMDIIDVNILNLYEDDENFKQHGKANAKKIEECLVSTLKIGISCSVDSPSQRMYTKSVLKELQDILRILQNN